MFCQSCGKEIKDGSKFCKYCGSKIKNAENMGVTVNKPNVSSSNDNSKLIIIAALSVVIIVLVILIGTFSLGLFGDNGGATLDNQGEDYVEPVSLTSFPVSRAPDLAQTIKNSNGNFPVQFESLSLSKSQCLYILTKSIYEIGSGHPNAKFSVGNPDYAANPGGRDSPQTISSANYIDMAGRFSTWIETYNSVPNYIGVYTSGVYDVSPSKMLDMSVEILLQYKNTGSLPTSINI